MEKKTNILNTITNKEIFICYDRFLRLSLVNLLNKAARPW
jgi:hypothetical protein